MLARCKTIFVCGWYSAKLLYHYTGLLLGLDMLLELQISVLYRIGGSCVVYIEALF